MSLFYNAGTWFLHFFLPCMVDSLKMVGFSGNIFFASAIQIIHLSEGFTLRKITLENMAELLTAI